MNADEGSDVTFRSEFINVAAATAVGGTKEAATLRVKGMSLRRWLSAFAVRAQLLADDLGEPYSDIMSIRTAWRDVAHAGVTFA
eukprot:15462375-Alexandrium_andersonii.AAC.1